MTGIWRRRRTTPARNIQGSGNVPSGTFPRRVDRIAAPAVKTGRPNGTLALAGPSSSVTMESDHFGTILRRAREARTLLLADVAHRTKVARATLDAMEKGDLASLPAPVYVRGFIRSYARAVGADEAVPLALYDRALERRNAAKEEKESIPTVDPEVVARERTSLVDDESMAPRRGLGLAVFVIILLLIATITLSLLLRRPPQSGEGLSERSVAPSSAAIQSA